MKKYYCKSFSAVVEASIYSPIVCLKLPVAIDSLSDCLKN